MQADWRCDCIETQQIKIEGIPAVIQGAGSNRLLIAVHGGMASKSDTTIALLAEVAARKDYQVLSFDLPEHGDRNLDLFSEE